VAGAGANGHNVDMDDRPEIPTTHVVCANLIIDDRGLLLVRESKPSALGRWSLPAGRLEPGESLADGAAREAFEETGLVVEVGPLVGIYHSPVTLEGGAAISFVFRSAISGGELRRSPEHSDIAFVPRERFDELVAADLIRGRHVALALAALDRGAEVPTGVVVEVAAPRPPT
jgi:ADP-ribose pyrophosphatase YjhB (NUDIX family)